MNPAVPNPAESPAEPSAESSAGARLAGRVVLALGWVSFGLIATGLAVEAYPGLEGAVTRLAAKAIGRPIASSMVIGDVDILWLERSVALHDVRMGPGGDDLVVDSLVCRLGYSPTRGVHLDRLTVRGGEVVLSETLAAGLRGGPGETDEDGSLSAAAVLEGTPEIILRDVALGVELAAGEDAIPLGKVDLSMMHGAGPDGARVCGRLVPTLGRVPGTSGVVWLSGALTPDGVLEVEGVARALELPRDAIARVAAGTAFEAFEPTARVDLIASARFDVERSFLPTLDAHLALSSGSMRLPWVSRADERRVEDVTLGARVTYDPEAPDSPFDPGAWSAVGNLDAHWEGYRAASGFRAGRAAPAGHRFEVWAHLPDAPLGDRLTELAAGEKGIIEVEKMLAPRGRADVTLGVRLPKGAAEGDALTPRAVARGLERHLWVQPRGDASLSYNGAFDPRRGVRDVGFPLPVRRVSGDVTWSIRPGARYPGQLAFYDARAFHPGGPVDVQGSLHFVPRWLFSSPSLAGLDPAPFHLAIETSGLAVDDDFRTAMAALDEIPEVAEIMPAYSPSGGALDFRLVLRRTVERTRLSMDLDVTLRDLEARWRELSVPLEGIEGRVHVRTGGEGLERGRSTTTVDLTARTEVAHAPVELEGRIRSEGIDRALSWIEVHVPGLNTRSSALREVLVRKNPEIQAAVDAAGPSGFMDVDITATREFADPREGDPFGCGTALIASARPRADSPALGSRSREGFTLEPAQFTVKTRDVRGSLRVEARLPPDPLRGPGARRDPGKAPEPLPADSLPEPEVKALARIQGNWRQPGPPVPLAAYLEQDPGRPAQLRALGAGLDIANEGLVGALIDAAREAGRDRVGASDPIDTDAIDVDGRVDFGALLELPEAPGLPLERADFEVEARLERLAIGGNQLLRDVSASFRYVEESSAWVGDRVDALLGATPVTLEGVEWRPVEGGSVLRTTLSAEGLPVDAEHLGFFLDEATKRIMLEDLGARGQFDLVGAELTLTRTDDGRSSVELDGQIRIEDAFVDLGVPVELSSVESFDVRLVHGGRGLRARADVSGVFGAIAGRRLENASMGLTYVEPRLVIEGLEGGFEGGRLEAIGRSASTAANLFEIDLADPFPFALNAAMRDVDVGEFLRGVFDSDFANRGRMDLDMRLAGNLEELTALEGRGQITIDESALWAIPVFQALSASLGIDTTVLFRRMRCDYTIEDGALVMERMRVNSDLLSLVGQGSITFEGDVTSDLEVRYGLVDRLGPLTRLVYWIQNSLLRVSIRGTMERPTVVLRGLVSGLFSPSEERDRLPLPGFSKRPRRF